MTQARKEARLRAPLIDPTSPGFLRLPAAVREAIPLSPFLVLYILAVLALARNEIVGDDTRYLKYAENLTHGYYSPPDRPFVWNGPGYPLVLAPFVALRSPLILPKLLNALFLFGAVLFVFFTIRRLAPASKARLVAILFGAYYPFYLSLPLVLTEILSVFLVAAFLFFFTGALRTPTRSRAPAVAASALLAFLALTKIYFGYVALACGACSLLMAAIRRERAYLRAASIYGIALALCLPYLAYTYSLTGRVFYWSDSGGGGFYCMATPFSGEYGDWFDYKGIENEPGREEHAALSKEIEGLSWSDQEKRLRAKALEYIAADPKKFLLNWVSNVGRLFFSFPFSYQLQKPSALFYVLPNAFLVTLSALSLLVAWKGRRLLGADIISVGLFGLLGFLGLSVVASFTRMLYPIVPALFAWTAAVAFTLLDLRVRTE